MIPVLTEVQWWLQPWYWYDICINQLKTSDMTSFVLNWHVSLALIGPSNMWSLGSGTDSLAPLLVTSMSCTSFLLSYLSYFMTTMACGILRWALISEMRTPSAVPTSIWYTWASVRVLSLIFKPFLGLYPDWLPGKRYHPWNTCGKPPHSHPDDTVLLF